MIATVGKVLEEGRGSVSILTVRPPADRLSDEVTVIWTDRQRISADQRRKAYALMGEIAEWSGNTPEEVKAAMKIDFRRKACEELQMELISLADCTMTDARLFINMLIDFCIEFNVQTKYPLFEYIDDVQAYVYTCMMHRKCAVCGKKADIHHVERVGMGRNRDTICHIGMPALPLCRTHHRECHDHGDDALMEKYHLEPIEIDAVIAKKYKLGVSKG